MTLGVRELREAVLSFAIYEYGRRQRNEEPELPSLSDEQLGGVIDDLLNSNKRLWGHPTRQPSLDCEGVAQEQGKAVRGKTNRLIGPY